MSRVDIKGLDKAEVLKELYDNSHYQGISFLAATDKEFTVEEARELLKECTYFDYLHGKVLKVDLSSDESFDSSLYNRDCGEGRAEEVIKDLRESKEEKNPQLYVTMTSNNLKRLKKYGKLSFTQGHIELYPTKEMALNHRSFFDMHLCVFKSDKVHTSIVLRRELSKEDLLTQHSLV